MSDDNYQGTNVGQLGRNVSAQTVNNTQITLLGRELDFSAIAGELSMLRTAARKRAVQPEEDAAVAELGRAEVAAKRGDIKGVQSSLKSAGGWALKVATEIGASICAKLIEAQL